MITNLFRMNFSLGKSIYQLPRAATSYQKLVDIKQIYSFTVLKAKKPSTTVHRAGSLWRHRRRICSIYVSLTWPLEAADNLWCSLACSCTTPTSCLPQFSYGPLLCSSDAPLHKDTLNFIRMISKFLTTPYFQTKLTFMYQRLRLGHILLQDIVRPITLHILPNRS